jgi:hypothetical protein
VFRLVATGMLNKQIAFQLRTVEKTITVHRARVMAKTGTIFDRTRMPLRTWFAAMWFVTSQKDGASALGLKRVLGLGSYQTAWAWLHKFRQAMVRPDRDRLCGRIEVDEYLMCLVIVWCHLFAMSLKGAPRF